MNCKIQALRFIRLPAQTDYRGWFGLLETLTDSEQRFNIALIVEIVNHRAEVLAILASQQGG